MPPSVPVSQSLVTQQTKRTNATPPLSRTSVSKDGAAAISSGQTTSTDTSKGVKKSRSRVQNERVGGYVRSNENPRRAGNFDDNHAAAGTTTPSIRTSGMGTFDASIPTSGMIGSAGAGVYGGTYGGMMGAPYFPSYGYGGMMPGGGMQPFSGLNQFLFSVQSVIFSLGQAVQILGMNTHALGQLLETAGTMFDHALSTWKEMNALTSPSETESEEEKKRRRRLRTIRWMMVMSFTYLFYKIVRRIVGVSRRKRTRRHLMTSPQDALRNNSKAHYAQGFDRRIMPHQHATYGYTSGYSPGTLSSYGSPFSGGSNPSAFSSHGYPHHGGF